MHPSYIPAGFFNSSFVQFQSNLHYTWFPMIRIACVDYSIFSRENWREAPLMTYAWAGTHPTGKIIGHPFLVFHAHERISNWSTTFSSASAFEERAIFTEWYIELIGVRKQGPNWMTFVLVLLVLWAIMNYWKSLRCFEQVWLKWLTRCFWINEWIERDATTAAEFMSNSSTL